MSIVYHHSKKRRTNYLMLRSCKDRLNMSGGKEMRNRLSWCHSYMQGNEMSVERLANFKLVNVPNPCNLWWRKNGAI